MLGNTNVYSLLRASNIPFCIHSTELSDNEMARSISNRTLPFPIHASLKTLAFVDTERPTEAIYLIAMPISDRLNVAALAQRLGISRKTLALASPATLHRFTGWLPGVVAPVSLSPGCLIFFDACIADLDIVFCGCGIVNSIMEIAARDLLNLPRANVAKLAQRNVS